ncbi:MAG: hypothetical protein WEB52_12740 [Dehalococcoidia bacterium]
MNESTFDRDIGAIAARASYPATPSLRAGVLASIAGTPATRRTTPHTRPPFAFAGAALAIVLAAIVATLAVPSSRSAVADFFGIEGSEIEVIPAETPLPPPDDIASRAWLTSIDDASDATGFDLVLPAGEDPRATYIVRYGDQAVAVIRYDEFDLWQARLPSDANFGKGAPPGVTVEDTFVDGMPARWVSGGAHIVQFYDAGGVFVPGSDRTVEANTLIWNDGQTFFRMETALAFDDALRIAESLP